MRRKVQSAGPVSSSSSHRSGTATEAPGRARNVIIEFESLAAAKDCYNSPEYQAAKRIRQSVADGEIVLVEGA